MALINIDPTVDIPADVTIESRIPPAYESCSLIAASEFRETDFTDICDNSTKYNPVLSSSDLISQSSENDSIKIGDNIVVSNIIQMDLFPNPFNSNFNLKYTISQAESVKFKLYNSVGSLIREWEKEQPYEGTYTQSIEGTDLADGIYILTMETSSGINSAKINKFSN